MTAEIMSFFERNPFSTPVGQRIEQATDASLASENWALNMEICDLINDTEDGPKDGIKALRKRLQQNAGKNYTVVMYTLTVLETCVKNCGRRFHILACNKEFVQELVKLIGPKNDPPTVVQEKVLSLIQSWADAFRQQTELQGVVQVYNDLRQKGIEFPMTDLDTMAPIITPQRPQSSSTSAPHPSQFLMEGETKTVAERAPSPGQPMRVAAAPSPPPASASPPTLVGTEAVTAAVAAAQQNLSAEQLGKLRSELDVVQTNMNVLGAMLSEITPGQEHPSDLTLLQELHATCRAMQRRLVDLIGKVAHDQMTAELLRINDEMNNLFLRYGRYEKNRDASGKTRAGAVGAAAAGVGVVASGAGEAASLIDLSDNTTGESSDHINSQMSGLSLTGPSATSQLNQITSLPAQQGAEAEDSEFDMFAQARNVTYESSKKGSSSYQDNLQPDQTSASLGEMAQTRSQPLQRETDFDEIEAWLGEKPGEATEAVESLTSSEFERFLAERAAAAEQLPTVNTGTPRPIGQASPGRPGAQTTRELDKDETENTLFAL